MEFDWQTVKQTNTRKLQNTHFRHILHPSTIRVIRLYLEIGYKNAFILLCCLTDCKIEKCCAIFVWFYEFIRFFAQYWTGILTGILLLFFLLLPFWTISFLIVCSDIWSVVFNVYDFQCFYVFVLNVIVVVDFDCLLCKMKELINGVEIEQTSFDGECRSWVGHLSFVHWTSNSNSVALVYFAIFQKWCMHIWRNQAENFW